MGGVGSGRRSKREYASRARAVNQLNGLVPRAIQNARKLLEDEDPNIRWMATQWVLEKATGKPKQEVAILAQERVEIVIRILGPDGKPLPEPGTAQIIDGHARELPESA